MGKLHKEIAVSLVAAANDEDVTDQQVVKVRLGLKCFSICPHYALLQIN